MTAITLELRPVINLNYSFTISAKHNPDIKIRAQPQSENYCYATDCWGR